MGQQVEPDFVGGIDGRAFGRDELFAALAALMNLSRFPLNEPRPHPALCCRRHLARWKD
jgi:hypothetical protein